MSVYFETVEGPTEEEVARRSRLTAAALALSKQPGVPPDRIQEAWNEVSMAVPTSYTINSVGHWRMCQIQIELGMQIPARMPEFPEPEAYGLTYWPMAPEEREEGDELTPDESAFLVRVRQVLNRDAQTDAIPSYKMTSDDSWLITPREIAAALTRYGKVPQARKDGLIQTEGPWWRNWIDFLTVAAQRGGFHKG